MAPSPSSFRCWPSPQMFFPWRRGKSFFLPVSSLRLQRFIFLFFFLDRHSFFRLLSLFFDCVVQPSSWVPVPPVVTFGESTLCFAIPISYGQFAGVVVPILKNSLAIPPAFLPCLMNQFFLSGGTQVFLIFAFLSQPEEIYRVLSPCLTQPRRNGSLFFSF